MLDNLLPLVTRYELRGGKVFFWSESEDSVHGCPSSFETQSAVGNGGGREHGTDKAA